MNWLSFYTIHPVETLILISLFGVIIGSFLNVIIYRYPLMLEREWNTDCAIQLNLPLPKKKSVFNLCYPRSHCTHCQKTLPFWLNIPILSYLFLRGKCHFCKTSISLRYLLVELLTSLLSVLVVLRYGLTLQTAALLLFTYVIITLSVIDIRHQFLPDTMTLSLLWVGLILSTQTLFIASTQAIFGALFGYLFLFLIAKSYILIRKKEGMGLGDCKMLGMIGAWVGVMSLLNVLLLSAFLALIVSVILIIFKKHTHQNPIPYGPFIGIAGWCTMMYGDQLMQWVASWIH